MCENLNSGTVEQHMFDLYLMWWQQIILYMRVLPLHGGWLCSELPDRFTPSIGSWHCGVIPDLAPLLSYWISPCIVFGWFLSKEAHSQLVYPYPCTILAYFPTCYADIWIVAWTVAFACPPSVSVSMVRSPQPPKPPPHPLTLSLWWFRLSTTTFLFVALVGCPLRVTCTKPRKPWHPSFAVFPYCRLSLHLSLFFLATQERQYLKRYFANLPLSCLLF